MTDETTVGDLDDDRAVHVSGRSDPDMRVHTDPDCRHLGYPRYGKTASLLHDDRLVCLECLGDVPTGGVEDGVNCSATRERLLEMDEDTSPRDLVTDGGTDADFRARPVAIRRDGKRVAAGALMPGGEIVVEWNRLAFPEGERTEDLTISVYSHIEDAEQASGGEVVVNPDVDDGPEVRPDA